MDYMDEQQTTQKAMDELKDDMLPIANHMIKLTIDELAEIGTEFRGEDLLFLVKRLLRNTHLLIKLVDQLEGMMGLADEVDLLGKQVFNQVVMQLDQWSRKGYFRIANRRNADRRPGRWRVGFRGYPGLGDIVGGYDPGSQSSPSRESPIHAGTCPPDE